MFVCVVLSSSTQGQSCSSSDDEGRDGRVSYEIFALETKSRKCDARCVEYHFIRHVATIPPEEGVKMSSLPPVYKTKRKKRDVVLQSIYGLLHYGKK